MRVLASGPVGDMLEFLFFGDQEFSLPDPHVSHPALNLQSGQDAQG